MLNQITPELQTLKSKLKTTWSAGDYGRVARELEKSAHEFLARHPVDPGMRVLDVACGTGQLALPAARAGADVCGVDIAPNLIEQARDRAKTEGLKIRFDEGDAEALPYEDASFDLVISLIGAMFAPRPDRVTAELMRVCRPGGRIIMGNWTAEGFIGSMFKTVTKYVPASPIMPSPLLWGSEATVRERFKDGIANLQLTRAMYPFYYPYGPTKVVDFYRDYFGPTYQAFKILDDEDQALLYDDLVQLWTTHNQAKGGNTYLEAEILEVVATRAIN